MPLQQLNMFGPPELVEDLPDRARRRDDAPVPGERELLWPQPHADALGAELLEQLYGDLPRRTRLLVQEVCRRLRCGHTHVYDLVDAGSLDATDDRHPDAQQPSIRIYRYSLVRFLFHREFVDGATRCGLPAEDLHRCCTLADDLRAKTRRLEDEFDVDLVQGRRDAAAV